MRYRIVAALASCCCLVTSGDSQAQSMPTGGYPPTPFNAMPNFYNRQTQPLSPYLNLLRGGSVPVNYYYGVRPGLPSGGMTNAANVGGYGQAGSNAGGFLPQANIAYDPNAPLFEIGGQPVQMRSAAHPALYGNQFAGHGGFQSVYAQNVNRSGFQPGFGLGGAARPALGGLGGMTRGTGVPPARTR